MFSSRGLSADMNEKKTGVTFDYILKWNTKFVDEIN